MSETAPEMGQGEGTLSRAAGMVREAKGDFDKISAKMDGKIEALRGRWAGSGGQAFFILKDAWVEKQKVIVSALDEFEAALTGTERDNIATDEAQSTTMGNLQRRL